MVFVIRQLIKELVDSKAIAVMAVVIVAKSVKEPFNFVRFILTNSLEYSISLESDY